jgi:hypothetical protein
VANCQNCRSWLSDHVAALGPSLPANSGYLAQQSGSNAGFMACLKRVTFDHFDNESLLTAMQRAG